MLRALFLFAALFASDAVGTPPEHPIHFVDRLIRVRVEISGKPFSFVLDSGAGATVVDLSVARSLGLRLGEVEWIQGIGGMARSYRIDHFQGDFGGVPLPPSLLAVDLNSVSLMCHQSIDGLIGADFLHSRVVQIDFARRILRVMATASPATATVVKMRRRNGAFSIPVDIDGDTQWVRLDTGCDEALHWASKASYRRLPAGVEELDTEVRLGHALLPNTKTRILRERVFPGEAGLIGNLILSRYRLTIDGPGMRLFLETPEPVQ